MERYVIISAKATLECTIREKYAGSCTRRHWSGALPAMSLFMGIGSVRDSDGISIRLICPFVLTRHGVAGAVPIARNCGGRLVPQQSDVVVELVARSTRILRQAMERLRAAGVIGGFEPSVLSRDPQAEIRIAAPRVGPRVGRV